MRKRLLLICIAWLLMMSVQGRVGKKDLTRDEKEDTITKSESNEAMAFGEREETKEDRGDIIIENRSSDDITFEEDRTVEGQIRAEDTENAALETAVDYIKRKRSGPSINGNRVVETAVDYIRHKRNAPSDDDLSTLDLANFAYRLHQFAGSLVGETPGPGRAEEEKKEMLLRLQVLSQTLAQQAMTPDATPPIPYTCNRPFEEIAYRMCILQEVNMRLSWQGAQDYCQERGAMLAYDSVVVKARRFFNDLYGEEGSRVRWPFWIGGKKDVDWKWHNGSPVPSFLWASEQPRSYPPVLAPQGTCMIIDGYQEFYGASLPCHLKRRFVCQIPG